MHEVVLDFEGLDTIEEEGPYAFIKIKIAVKRNLTDGALKNSVHFDVHSITAGILNRGGKQCLKPVTFEGFSVVQITIKASTTWCVACTIVAPSKDG